MDNDFSPVIYGSICKESGGFVSEVVYTNDPDAMVKHCLSCTLPFCSRGECQYTRNGEGRRKRMRKSEPPLSLESVRLVVKMRNDGWRKKMIARELGLTVYQVERSLDWHEKEGDSMGITEETRREAYGSVDVTEMESKVLSVICERGAASSEEIMDAIGTSNPNNVRPRLTALRDKGIIEPEGKRKNRAGKSETVWRVVL